MAKEYSKMFNLEMGEEDWYLVFTQKNSTEDISYMTEGNRVIVKEVQKALKEDELFSIFDLNEVDTLDLMSTLSEIEMCSSWNGFEHRSTDNIVNSLVNMLLTHDIYGLDGIKIGE